MTIDKDYTFGIYTVDCDIKGCPYSKNYDIDGNWDVLIKEMKEDGWKSKRVNGEWEHYCPVCVSNKKV